MRTPAFTDVRKKLKPAAAGTARIMHEAPDKLTRIRAAMDRQPLNRAVYVRLLVNGKCVMTDAEFERLSNLELLRAAKGDCLVAGLGIGLVLDPLIAACRSVTVIEKNADVIKVSGHAFPQVRIECADVFTWTPPLGAKYDCIYFDIWSRICVDDLKEARVLHRRFRKYLRPDGYMQSWCRLALELLS